MTASLSMSISDEYSKEFVQALDQLAISMTAKTHMLQLHRAAMEQSYVRGADMTRRLLRLQLGLATKEDIEQI